jgi:hypothetical protein
MTILLIGLIGLIILAIPLFWFVREYVKIQVKEYQRAERLRKQEEFYRQEEEHRKKEERLKRLYSSPNYTPHKPPRSEEDE